MGERITDRQVHGCADTVNAILARRGTVARFNVYRSCGRMAVDLVAVSDNGFALPTTVRDLHRGTAGETYSYLRGALEALLALEAPYLTEGGD